jgi:photosystem II stability/assembly factor-like uncharacterized protein
MRSGPLVAVMATLCLATTACTPGRPVAGDRTTVTTAHTSSTPPPPTTAMTAVTPSVRPSPTSTPRKSAAAYLNSWPITASIVWSFVGRQNGDQVALDRTTDGGARWSDVLPRGLPNFVGKKCFSYWSGAFALGSEKAWLSYARGSYSSGNSRGETLYATTDGGRHWRVVGDLPHGRCSVQFVTPNDGWCTWGSGAAGNEGFELFRTINGGSSWQRVTGTGGYDDPQPAGAIPYNCDKRAVFVTPQMGWAPTYCIASRPTLYRTTDRGESWSPFSLPDAPGNLSRGASFGVPVVAGNLGAVEANGQSADIIIDRTSDGGACWQPVLTPASIARSAVDIVTPLDWRFIYGAELLTTSDAGRTWHLARTNHDFTQRWDGNPGTLTFLNTEVGWLTNESELWRTADGGKVWQQVPTPTPPT